MKEECADEFLRKETCAEPAFGPISHDIREGAIKNNRHGDQSHEQIKRN